jgi:hypothetical protein
MTPRAINIAAAVGALIIAYAMIYTDARPFVIIGGTITCSGSAGPGSVGSIRWSAGQCSASCGDCWGDTALTN